MRHLFCVWAGICRVCCVQRYTKYSVCSGAHDEHGAAHDEHDCRAYYQYCQAHDEHDCRAIYDYDGAAHDEHGEAYNNHGAAHD